MYDEAVLGEKAIDYLACEKNQDFRREVEMAMKRQNWDELNERFYTELAFGTAGMRGVIGGGTNRINTFMVCKVTQGLALYLKKLEKPQVVIAYDSRNYSDVFATTAACVLAANGIKTLLYDTIHPVPMLSYAVRYTSSSAGIVITASHNPSKYNGYKVYWSDGGQVTPPHDVEIARLANGVTQSDILDISEADARKQGLIVPVPEEVDRSYYRMALSLIKREECIASSGAHVVYTPLHGTGLVPVTTLFEKMGVSCSVVEQQREPDGAFPTVPLPNPESALAMKMAVALAKEKKADLVLGTDPDADRLGVAIPTDGTKSDYLLLTGNQIASLLADYLIQRTDSEKRAVVVKSIVTTDLVKAVASDAGARCVDVLTGFKYIAEQIEKLSSSSDEYFLMGCEESYGFLTTGEVRDKDAVSSACVLVEMVSWYTSRGISLIDRLNELYRKFGYYQEMVLSREYPGQEGGEKIRSLMAQMREVKAGDTLLDFTVAEVEDLLKGELGLPASDVVIIRFTDGSKLVVRPSGTEPKIKYYLMLRLDNDNRQAAGELKRRFEEHFA